MLWTDIYLNRVCAKVYEIRVFKVYLEIQQWRLGKANLLGMTASGSDWKKWTVFWRQHQRKSEHRYSTVAKAASDLSAFWNEKILFVQWKFSGMYCRHGLKSSSSAKLIASGVNSSGQIIFDVSARFQTR